MVYWIEKAMEQRGSKHILAAIAFTDVESFTPKMAADEEHTLSLLHRDFAVIRQLCAEYNGETIKSLGDGLLLYFTSAEHAITCAVEIQKAIATTAANLAEKDILIHRIGIHLGDILYDGSDVMGNGVNMAARLQALAPPGGICISSTVYEVTKSVLTLPPTYIGVRKLKGIPEPVPIYHIDPPHSNRLPQQRLFISYATQEPDTSLAQQLFEGLTEVGYAVFMAGASLRFGENWPYRIETELKQCDYLVLLLSERSANSEMVAEEVRRVKELQDLHPNKKPFILPIRVQFPLTSPLNYNLRGYLDRIQQREWCSETDTPALLQEIIRRVQTGAVPEESETSQTQSWETANQPPQPSAVPELPEGQMDVASVFYIERPPAEERCYEMVMQAGSLIRIKAPRQMGKTSLMARVLHYAQKQGYRTISLSFQLADRQIFADLDKFLCWFCASVGRRLRLPNHINDYWDDIFGSKDNSTAYFEEYLLNSIESPLVLGLDEVDRLFEYPDLAADFLGLLRAWHEEAKNQPIWKKLRLIVVHATDVYVPMDINQSPFNVGLPIELSEFTRQQVEQLVELHELKFTPMELDALVYIIGGHPFLIRLALYHIARQDTTIAKFLSAAPTESGYYGDHLRGHLWRLQQYPELAAAMEQVANSDEPVRLDATVGFKLSGLGLVRLCGNDATVRSELYRRYFCDRL
ncbi:AAA-like domain-containing protein [Roseofilum casamattae]|uniref:AAA-like domain-containing protein n=1 Tax=Roseofilum casamattae BLCC-M143 TaxID=3022442 RepID=A0ABT7BXF1_9CYAN|nr:AAA-like domain-containing protein [Roseofilum casamattae]MDJ1183835.1 AAA-like domain-containing protein [Roseofilum casamattae BLCC-M143]